MWGDRLIQRGGHNRKLAIEAVAMPEIILNSTTNSLFLEICVLCRHIRNCDVMWYQDLVTALDLLCWWTIMRADNACATKLWERSADGLVWMLRSETCTSWEHKVDAILGRCKTTWA